MARKSLAIPASSVTSEREFKVAKFASKYRYRLKAANLKSIIFLAYNLETLGYPLLPEMETPPAGFKKPNGPLRFTVTDCDGQPGTVAGSDDRHHGIDTQEPAII